MSLEMQGTNYRSLVAGVDTRVPLANGEWVTAINFDNAATTPPFLSVIQEIIDFAPWYASIHRGTGYKSQISSNMYEISRNIVADFINADMKRNSVIFVKNTTEAINKLAYRLCNGSNRCVILSTGMEHHSNDLPWRDKYQIDYVTIDAQGRLSLEDLERKLEQYQGSIKLVTVTGASNVTGYINPVHTIASLVHRYNARLLVDGAQLIPHVPFDMKPDDDPEHIDFLVFSGHKMYAPFGTGVLIGPKQFFQGGSPEYSGGGTVDIVTHDLVKWLEPPHKEEAGTPNLMGVVALSAAIQTLRTIGMESIAKHESDLTAYALQRLQKIPGIIIYRDLQNNQDAVGIIAFNIQDIPHDILAAALSFEWGIAVRNGCFCAQPYIQKLLHIRPEEIQERLMNRHAYRPGMVRLSFGLYNQPYEIDRLIEALKAITAHKQAILEKYRYLSAYQEKDLF